MLNRKSFTVVLSAVILLARAGALPNTSQGVKSKNMYSYSLRAAAAAASSAAGNKQQLDHNEPVLDQDAADTSASSMSAPSRSLVEGSRPRTGRAKSNEPMEMIDPPPLDMMTSNRSFASSSPNILLDMLDDDLVSLARAVNVLDPSLHAKADTFDANRIDELRVPLEKDTLAALAGASTDQTNELIQISPVLSTWNARGDQVVDGGTATLRQGLCHLISTETSKADQSTRDCMCGTDDPFIRCQMMLANQAIAYGSVRSARNRGDYNAHVRRVQSFPERMTQATCDLEITPSNLLPPQPSFVELLNVVTNTDSLSIESPEIEIEGSCCFDLQPPPLNAFEACGEVTVSIPGVEFLTLEGAQRQIDSGIIVKGSDALKEAAGDIEVALSLKLCIAINAELEKAPELANILDFLGIDLCFAAQTFNMWPARGSAEFSLQSKLAVVTASVALLWQTDTALRDTLGLCDDVEPACGDKETVFCSMHQNGVVGFVELVVDFFLLQKSITIPVGEGFYSDCNKDTPDGQICFLGSSCYRCENSATYWYGPAFTACGTEPRYPDGTLCLPGFSCNSCENPSTYWYGPAVQMCGPEPKYSDGTLCLPGFSCNNCENPSTYWYGSAAQMCGPEPKYPDGTLCLPELSCNSCENPSTYWYGPAAQKCGPEPKYPDGTLCLPGFSCNSCENSSTYWYGPAAEMCGPEPKYPDGTLCLPGFSCNSCENPSTYWYGPAAEMCGLEPKYPDGTMCLPGFSCNSCENPSTYWYGPAAQMCGPEPCYPAGTWCLIGTSCNMCCNGQSWSRCN